MNNKKITRQQHSVHGRSAAYIIGYQHAQVAASEHGRTAVSPSQIEREDFRYSWGQFMAGWEAGMRDWRNQ